MVSGYHYYTIVYYQGYSHLLCIHYGTTGVTQLNPYVNEALSMIMSTVMLCNTTLMLMRLCYDNEPGIHYHRVFYDNEHLNIIYDKG